MSEETLNKITRKEVKGVGTPAFMSPEIFKIVTGKSPKIVLPSAQELFDFYDKSD